VPLSNFGLVHPGLFRCAQPDADGWRPLWLLGVTFAVKLSTSSEYPLDNEAREAGSKVQIQESPIDQWKPDAEVVRRLVSDIVAWENAGAIGVVHCAHGRDRTGLVIGAYRLLVDHWTLDHVNAERKLYGVAGIIRLADEAINDCLRDIARECGREEE
jgi:protein-tyrosine phosphatase